jgi:hypothetical protein
MSEESVSGDDAGVPGVRTVSSRGDSESTRCLDVPGDNTSCLYGLAADSNDGSNLYGNWGTMLTLLMAEEDSDGMLLSARDAQALGNTALRFQISGLSGGVRVRPQVVMADSESIPFSEEGFVNGNDDENILVADDTYTLYFDNFYPPSWASYLELCIDVGSCDFDPSRLHSLRFWVATSPAVTYPYDFCISNLTWLNASGGPVDVPVP